MQCPSVLTRTIYDIARFSVPAINSRILRNGATISLLENTDSEYQKSELVGEFFRQDKLCYYHCSKEQMSLFDVDELFELSVEMVNERFPVSQDLWDRLHSFKWSPTSSLLSFSAIKKLVCEEFGVNVDDLPSTCYDFVYVKGDTVFRYHLFDVPGNFTRFIADALADTTLLSRLSSGDYEEYDLKKAV